MQAVSPLLLTLQHNQGEQGLLGASSGLLYGHVGWRWASARGLPPPLGGQVPATVEATGPNVDQLRDDGATELASTKNFFILVKCPVQLVWESRVENLSQNNSKRVNYAVVGTQISEQDSGDQEKAHGTQVGHTMPVNISI